MWSTIAARWITPKADSTQPMPNAAIGDIRRDGNGRSAVRRIRLSRSISINWLNAAEPNAASAVPKIVCTSGMNWPSHPPRDANTNPKNVVINTKKFSLTFINTARSARNPGAAGPSSSAATISASTTSVVSPFCRSGRSFSGFIHSKPATLCPHKQAQAPPGHPHPPVAC